MHKYNNKQLTSYDLYIHSKDFLDVTSIALSPIPLLKFKQSECLIGYSFRAVLEAKNERKSLISFGLPETILGLLKERDIYNVEMIIKELQKWVNIIVAHATRELVIYDQTALELSRDECIAVSLIAACQLGQISSAKSCAYSLTGLGIGVEHVVTESINMARCFFSNGIQLQSNSSATVIA